MGMPVAFVENDCQGFASDERTGGKFTPREALHDGKSQVCYGVGVRNGCRGKTRLLGDIL